MNDVQRELLDAVERRTGRRPSPAEALTALGIDSVELAEFIGVIEKRFCIRVDETVFDVATLEELARYVDERRK